MAIEHERSFLNSPLPLTHLPDQSQYISPAKIKAHTSGAIAGALGIGIVAAVIKDNNTAATIAATAEVVVGLFYLRSTKTAIRETLTNFPHNK